jgi:cytochrome c peroxidase
VWRLRGRRRQTPTLAGRVAATAPYDWHGSSATLEENIVQTVARLGGSGLALQDVQALARYLVEGLREPQAPAPAEPELVASGERLFRDPAVGCAGCHDPEAAFTGGGPHDVGTHSDLEVAELRAVEPKAEPQPFDTPSLRPVGLTPPYFHDGRAATLEEVLAHRGMGETGHLSAEDRRALVAYLRSL